MSFIDENRIELCLFHKDYDSLMSLLHSYNLSEILFYDEFNLISNFNLLLSIFIKFITLVNNENNFKKEELLKLSKELNEKNTFIKDLKYENNRFEEKIKKILERNEYLESRNVKLSTELFEEKEQIYNIEKKKFIKTNSNLLKNDKNIMILNNENNSKKINLKSEPIICDIYPFIENENYKLDLEKKINRLENQNKRFQKQISNLVLQNLYLEKISTTYKDIINTPKQIKKEFTVSSAKLYRYSENSHTNNKKKFKKKPIKVFEDKLLKTPSNENLNSLFNDIKISFGEENCLFNNSTMHQKKQITFSKHITITHVFILLFLIFISFIIKLKRKIF